MGPAEEQDSLKTEELLGIIREVRDRVRARYPASSSEVPLADLMPLVRARDAAAAKVAAIGTVNPRRGGPINALIQAAKRLISRALDWHVREQIEFNRHMVSCVEAALEALNECNRTLVVLSGQISELRRLENEARELKEIREHWARWRVDWEHKLESNEVHLQRRVSELQSAFLNRATLMEAVFRDITRSQHADFRNELERSGVEMQQKLWADFERVRLEYERLIHSELRLVRQRAALHPPAAEALAPAPAPAFDYARFAEKFRGSEESVKERQKLYIPFFAGCREILDIGCGRGEFLELMRGAGVNARGIDLSHECVELCRSKGLQAEVADLFLYLSDLPDTALDGIFCAQVVEHLPAERLPELIRLAAAKLQRGGVLALETPNPECLAIFATHFFLDPTHTRPVPPALLSFYMEEYGLGRIEVHRLFPALDSMPGLGSLPQDFRETFFGGLDYAIIGRKLL